MDLVTLRQKFVELSGHYELVVDADDWADNGADFYINAGQEFLDRRSNVWKKTARNFYEIDAGDWYQTFSRCRIIEEVWINNTEGRSKLEKKELTWLHQEYSGLVSALTAGTPAYWCPTKLRTLEATDIDNLGAFFNYVVDDSDSLRGVIMMPPADEAVVMEIIGQFYSTELSDDEDESFWTINHPALLILASLYQLEVLGHRNTQGANDYLLQIDREIIGLDKDLAEEESYDIDEMEG